MRKPIYSFLLGLMVSLLCTGCFRTRAEIAKEEEDKSMRSTMQQSLSDQSQAVDRLQTEIGAVRGRVEEVEFQKKKEITQLQTQREVLEKGLKEHREKSDKNFQALQDRMDQMQKNQDAMFEELKKTKEENTQLLKQLQEPEKKTASKSEAIGSLNKGIEAFKKKNYDEAIEEIQGFISQHPKSKKRLDAQFYLGESLYRKKDYQKAILELESVHEKSGSTTLGRKATLRIAESFKALGKEKDAKAFAQLLIDNHPASEEAKLARKLLK